MATWTESEAEAQSDTVLDHAESEGPHRVMRGKEVFYIMTPEQWKALGRAPALKKDGSDAEKGVRTLSEFFENSPLVGSGIDLTRNKWGPRKCAFVISQFRLLVLTSLLGWMCNEHAVTNFVPGTKSDEAFQLR